MESNQNYVALQDAPFDQFKKKPKYSAKDIFRVGPDDLMLFFKKKNMKLPDNEGEARMSLNILRNCGYTPGLCQLLVSEADSGIIGTQADLERRRRMFGKNRIALPQITSFLDLLANQFEDNNVQFLIVAATLYLLFSQYSQRQGAYIESLTIYCGVLFAAVISAICDYVKEKQFLKIRDEINNQEVIVYRGSFGSVETISVRDLVVGDVIDVQQGDRIPADCVLTEEMNITVDESIYGTEGYVEKELSKVNYENVDDGGEYDNHKRNPDPFLLTGTMVMTGSGKAIVCAVGDNTLLAQSRGKEDLVMKEQVTFLEEKLEQTAKSISKYAVVVCLLVILTQTLFLIAEMTFRGDRELFSSNTLLHIAKIAITAVCILIVAIPEGLPLAVSIAMALSINKLKNEEILIKNLESIQTCAMLHDICIGKTGIITEGIMNVVKYHICDQDIAHENDRKTDPRQFNESLEVQSQLRDLIKESIISNTDVRMVPNEEALTYEPQGQELEVGLVRFLIENNEDMRNNFISRNQYAPKVCQIPFDQEKKRKVVVRKVASDPTQCRIYVKGAPEYVINLCSDTYDFQANQKELDDDEKFRILSDIVTDQMAARGLKTLSYAYKQIPLDDMLYMMRTQNIESEEFRDELERDLIYLGSFGLEDPIRGVNDTEESGTGRMPVKDSIQLIRYGTILSEKINRSKGAKNQVNIRMITGDHIDTALYVAKEVGIISEEESQLDGIYMTGDDFRQKIGGYQKVWDHESNQYDVIFDNKPQFDKVKGRLRIIARASAEDRFILIAGIRQAGGLVAMTGDSISDAMALKKASVGLCMGSGCQVAKDNSDLVILDNDFLSIHRSIEWGRTIFENVSKFLQFQMAINITLCTVVLVSGATLGQSCFNVIQLLWINLIMDILGAIAICTEPPSKHYVLKEGEEVKSQRISRKDKIILPVMWRNIIGQVVFQLTVMFTLIYLGEFMFFEESFNLIWTKKRDPETGLPTDKMVLDTICFHTFICMNLFNMINSRVISPTELNVFKTLFNNPMLWLVLVFEIGLQSYMLWAAEGLLGSALLGLAPLTFWQNFTCWALGALSIPACIAFKHIPLDKFGFVPEIENNDGNDPVSRWLNKAQNSLEQQRAKLKEKVNINDSDSETELTERKSSVAKAAAAQSEEEDI